MNNTTQEIVDRWIPNYRELGYTAEQAREIAAECERRHAAGDTRDWTDIVAEVVSERA